MHTRFVPRERFRFLVGRRDGHHEKSLLNDISVMGFSATNAAQGQKRATGQEDTGVEGSVGSDIWKALLQDEEGKGTACSLPAQRGGRSWCSHSPLLLTALRG